MKLVPTPQLNIVCAASQPDIIIFSMEFGCVAPHFYSCIATSPDPIEIIMTSGYDVMYMIYCEPPSRL